MHSRAIRHPPYWTMTVPVIPGWMSQVKPNCPGDANVSENEPLVLYPGDFPTPGTSTLCGCAVPDHAHVTVDPGVTVTVAGDQWFVSVAPMVTFIGGGGGGSVGVGVGGTGVGGGGVGVGGTCVGGGVGAGAVGVGVAVPAGGVVPATVALSCGEGDAAAAVVAVLVAAAVLVAVALAPAAAVAVADGVFVAVLSLSPPPQAATSSAAASAAAAIVVRTFMVRPSAGSANERGWALFAPHPLSIRSSVSLADLRPPVC